MSWQLFHLFQNHLFIGFKVTIFSVANEEWLNEQGEILNAIKKENSCCLSGDGRYLMYSLLKQSSNKIAGLVVTLWTEAGNSNRMEKYGFEKLLDEMQNNEIKISQTTTDCHVQIKKCMRENHKDINHQFDIWHVCKNLKKKLTQSAKKKSCSVING